MTNEDTNSPALASVAVVGAGVTGLVAARALSAAGLSVQVLDKSGDIGGRLATRRRDSTSWNHGAAFVEARGDAFAKLLAELKTAGSARPVRLPRGLGYRGVPDMRELLRPLVESLDCHFERRVDRLQRTSDGWLLHCSAGRGEAALPQELGPFGAVLLTLPAPQVEDLLTASGEHVPDALKAVVMSPAWSLLLRFASSADDSMDSVALDGVIESITRESDGTAWVVRFGTDWSAERLEWSAEQAAAAMLETLRSRVTHRSQLPEPELATAHRWRYAQTASPLGEYCLWEPDRGLALAGDWCLGAYAEHAFLSAQAVAAAIVAPQS